MANGRAASDWTVSVDGDGGTIECGQFRGRFKVSRIGVVQIIWQQGPMPKDDGPVTRAAQEAIEKAREA